MKKLGLGLGILVVIIIGAILIVPGFLNWNEYKDQIEQTASDFTGRDVRIKGDISLALLPTSALSVKGVTVTNMDGGRAEYMLSLKSLDIKVSFPSVISSLFGGQIKVEKFILVDPVVALEILDNGRVNWDLGGAENGADKPSTTADISLDKFQIVNGQVSFEDMASGQMELLRKINANVRATSINGPFDVEGSAKYKNLEAAIKVTLGKNRPGKKIPLTLTMSLLDDQVTVNAIGGVILSGEDSYYAGKLNMQASDAGDLLTLLDRFNGHKPAKATREAIKVGQDFAVDTAVELTSGKAVIKDLNIRLGKSRGQGGAEISLGDKVNIVADLSVNKLDIDPLLSALPEAAQDDTDSPALSGDLLNRLSGRVDMKLGALKYNGKIANQIAVKLLAKDGVIDIANIQARMPGGSALTFKGQISQEDTPVLTGDMSLSASNIRGLLSWLKMDVKDVPNGQLAQFSYKSRLKISEDMLQLYAMDGTLDALGFKGGISYAFASRPSYGISLALRNLNVDSYRTKIAPSSDQKIDLKKSLAVLDEFDVDYKISLSNVTVGGVKIRSGKLEGLLLGGNLEVKTIQLSDAAGVNLTLSGKGKNFSVKPEIALKISADAESLSRLQRSLKLDDKFDLRKLGKTRLTGTITTSHERMDMDMKSTIGGNKFDVKGTIRSATLKQFPEIGSADLEIDGRSTSLALLIDQLDLPMTRPRAKDDRPVRLKGRIKASSDLVDIDGIIKIAAGEILVKGRNRGKGKATTLDMSLDFKAPETREFIRGLGLDFQPSARKLGAIALKMKVTGSGDHYTLSNIVGDVGPVKLSGNGKLNMAAKKPYFDFNLKAGDIPFHSFLKKNTLKTSKEKQKVYGQWTRQAMDLSLMSAYEGRMQVSAASLRYNDYIFDNPAFEAVLKDGVLSVNDFTGRLFGGDVALAGTFGGAGKASMLLNMTLKKASLAQAVKSSAGISPVTGFFDMTGKFTGEGKSQYDIISSLSGDGKITASPGLISGVDIPALSARLADMDNNNAFLKLLGTTLSGGETPYKGGMSNITVKDGKIQFSPFDIELDGARSKVKMAIDLVNWTIKSDGRLSLVDHPNAPPIGVSITGDVSNPHVVYKTDRLKKYVGAKIASNLLQKLVGGEGGLEGIFGEKPKQAAPATTTPETTDPATLKSGETTDQKVVPKDKPKPAEEFGKRLLQKLFEKKPEKTEEPKP
ncbi:MAG: AsmA family protein [Alphaproteobacteria bacterium]|nr:AsmA family protein [Alphaproteobacteria bacterium]